MSVYLPRKRTGLAPISLMDAMTGDRGWSSVTCSASVVPSSYSTTSDPRQDWRRSLASRSLTRSHSPSRPSCRRRRLIRSEQRTDTAPDTWPLPKAKVGRQSSTSGVGRPPGCCFNAASSSEGETSFRLSWRTEEDFAAEDRRLDETGREDGR